MSGCCVSFMSKMLRFLRSMKEVSMITRSSFSKFNAPGMHISESNISNVKFPLTLCEKINDTSRCSNANVYPSICQLKALRSQVHSNNGPCLFDKGRSIFEFDVLSKKLRDCSFFGLKLSKDPCTLSLSHLGSPRNTCLERSAARRAADVKTSVCGAPGFVGA